MTNGERYKTAQERAEAFHAFCDSNSESHRGCGCVGCPLQPTNNCHFAWLDLECEEEKPLPCPCCGADAEIYYEDDVEREGDASVQCKGCFLATPDYPSDVEAVVAWNRRMSNQK